MAIADAQTSGGLLAACAPERVDDVLRTLDGEPARAVVGRVVEGQPGTVTVVGDIA
jgi:hydrogenase maturation factor